MLKAHKTCCWIILPLVPGTRRLINQSFGRVTDSLVGLIFLGKKCHDHHLSMHISSLMFMMTRDHSVEQKFFICILWNYPEINFAHLILGRDWFDLGPK